MNQYYLAFALGWACCKLKEFVMQEQAHKNEIKRRINSRPRAIKINNPSKYDHN
jgi:hypothetical protein